MFALSAGANASAQAPHTSFPVTDGPVRSFAIAGDTLFLAGDFGVVGAPSTSAAITDTATGIAFEAFPATDGPVEAIAADGVGGWYVGGSFTHVGNQPRAFLAHLRADLTVDGWHPTVHGVVRAIATRGGIVYVGGDEVGGDTVVYGWRDHLSSVVALDAATGATAAWRGRAYGGPVRTIAIDGPRVLIGGDFTLAGWSDGPPPGPWPTVGVARRFQAAALDATTGDLLDWSPATSGPVYGLAVADGIVYLGGNFSTVNGVTRLNVAAVDASTGAVTPWNGTARGGIVRAVAVARGKVYAGGDFQSIGGKPRRYLAALSTRWWQAVDWDPAPDAPVHALVVHGSTVYAGGAFRNIAGAGRYHAAAVDTLDGALRSWRPTPAGDVHALALAGARAAIGGVFACAEGSPRPGLAAIDRRTETLLPWMPDVSGPVRSVALCNGWLIASGHGPSGTVAVDTRTGARMPWGPLPGDGLVAISDTTVCVAGATTDSSTIDAMSTRRGPVTWHHMARRTDGPCLIEAALGVPGGVFLAGHFDRVPETFETWNLALLDPRSGALRHAYDTFGECSGLATYGSHVYVTGDSLTMLDIASGMRTGWRSSLSGLGAITATSRRLYVASRTGGMRAVDAATGWVVDWHVDSDAPVFALASADGVVYAGGTFTSIGGQWRGWLAAVDGAPVPLDVDPRPTASDFALSVTPNPVRSSARVAFVLPAAARATLDLVDLGGRRVARIVDSPALDAGPHQLALPCAGLAPAVYWLRLDAGGRRVSRAIAIVR